MKKVLLPILVFLFYGSGVSIAQDRDAAHQTAPVVIKSKTNRGDLPYRSFHRIFGRLLTLLPPPPRVIEPLFLMSFTELSLEEQDGFLKPTWNVAIVGDAVDVDIPIIRGGYFLLPQEQIPGASDASIMFNSQTKNNFLALAWKLQLSDQHTLRYRDFARSFKELASVQDKIPWYSVELWAEKRAKFDGLKACFASAAGEILVDRKPVPTLKSANCHVYQFDPALEAGDPEVSFVGPLDIVVLENSERYQPATAKQAN